ncbi:heparan-alpha-glucosaminide N-acetyltransferase-like [Pseudomyrmex gracilis]|uniref:heparan-alpha-glucosaminide N-acetyltransferase-like n=1 Tax=Pseudomyrmex gracilis TaxID=219809 RepID=UPI0009956A33|nr:heparan-alpha-glucosaminide N-acetyltransferase-like [Pseudomyrmex gracilis]
MVELNCVYDHLKFDEACVNVVANDNNFIDAWFYSLSADCVSCPYKRIASVSNNISLKFSTIKPLKWRVLSDGSDEYVSAKITSNVVCELLPKLEQYGLYEFAVQNGTCGFKTLKEPTYPYTELFIILGIIVLILFGISAGRSLWHMFKRQCLKKRNSQEEPSSKALAKRRVKAIDTFRGASILFMIFVNDGSGSYTILGHTTWDGMLPGDLVFPCFIWIMGFCIPIALSAQLRRGHPRLQISYSVLKRSFFLFLIGVALNTLGTNAQLENIRIFGVLQRFGITYLVVSLVYLCFTSRRMSNYTQNVSQTPLIREVLSLLPHWCIMLIFAFVHLVLTFSLPVPDCPSGYLGPGGRHEDGEYFNCTGGAAGYIDRTILTVNHIYQRSTISSVYGSIPFDPEGILGCLTSIFQVFLGVEAGIILMLYKDWKDRIFRWVLWAVIYGFLGCMLHFNNVIPVNKSLWSISFVLVSTSFALAFLSGCYLLIDVTKVWQGGPFRIPGMNALVLYVGHSMCYQIFPFHWRIGAMDSRALCLIESIWVVTLWTIIAYIMHRKRIYITL